jgi:hypothetical protein
MWANMQLRSVLIGLAAALALVVGGGVAGAAAYTSLAGPVKAGVIHGCYKTKASHGSHSVVLQNAGTACPAGETAIKWNEKGPAGRQGPPGPFPATLPSGKTLTGDYRTVFPSGSAVSIPDTQSFAFPLTSRPAVHFIGVGATPPAQCPGTATEPKAAPGNLCVYAALGDISATAVAIADRETNVAPEASPRGFSVFEANNDSFSTGSWAVTAP